MAEEAVDWDFDAGRPEPKRAGKITVKLQANGEPTERDIEKADHLLKVWAMPYVYRQSVAQALADARKEGEGERTLWIDAARERYAEHWDALCEDRKLLWNELALLRPLVEAVEAYRDSGYCDPVRQEEQEEALAKYRAEHPRKETA